MFKSAIIKFNDLVVSSMNIHLEQRTHGEKGMQCPCGCATAYRAVSIQIQTSRIKVRTTTMR